MKLLIILLFISFPGFTHALRTELSPDELKALKAGEEITRVKELKDEVFPQVTLINLIPHTPKENMRVFSDFESHTKFIPGLMKAKIVKKVPEYTDVYFELELPIVDNSQYTTRHFINYEGNDAILTWDLIKSKQVKRSKGMVMFEEFEGKTLFTYVTHITPASSFAWTVKSRVVPDTKKNIKAVINHLKKTAKN